MDGFHGRGPVCWQNCPEGYNRCGAMCLADGTKCGGMIFQQIGKVMKAIININNNKDKSSIVNIADVSSAFTYPICPRDESSQSEEEYFAAFDEAVEISEIEEDLEDIY